ncbi:MAG: S4 domain-containing protein, partial [Thermomicrobiales bacterium]
MRTCNLQPESAAWEDDEPRREVVVVGADEAGERLDRALAARFADLSRAYIQALIEDGQVTVAGRVRKASYRLRPGEQIAALIPPPTPSEPEPEAIPTTASTNVPAGLSLISRRAWACLQRPVPSVARSATPCWRPRPMCGATARF